MATANTTNPAPNFTAQINASLGRDTFYGEEGAVHLSKDKSVHASIKISVHSS
mgnify:CR=1 FL=1